MHYFAIPWIQKAGGLPVAWQTNDIADMDSIDARVHLFSLANLAVVLSARLYAEYGALPPEVK